MSIKRFTNHKLRKDSMTSKKRILRYLGLEKTLLVVSVIFGMVFVISQMSQPFILGLTLDYAKANNNQAFYVTLIISLCLSVIGTIFDYFFEYFVGKIAQRSIKRMRDEVFNKINSIPLKDFDTRSYGDLLQLELRDMESVSTGIFAVFKTLVQGVFTIVITIIMMFMVNWILAVGVIILTPLSVLMSSFVARKNHKYFKKQAELQSKLSAASLETIENIDIVQSMNYEGESLKNFNEINYKLNKEGKLAQFSASWINPSTRLVNNTIYILIGIAGIIMLAYDAKLALVLAVMSIGKLSSFLSYTTQYSKPFNEISSVITEFETAKFSFNRINEFLNLDNAIDDGKEDIKDIKSIKFDNMSFSYDSERELIKDFSLEISKGSKVAIVGPTGAGKTTLINLIMRFYEPIDGKILFNDISSNDISLSNLRKHFGMVLQDTWIFSGTILDNIKYAKPDATNEEIELAIAKAHVDSFINSLPDGLNTYITGKEGLSEGQRQMISIARVMLVNPEIVILDEATSNIDTRSEKLITDSFDEMMKSKTSIVIAHRLSTIKQADIIIVLKDGHIIETGNHKELMNKQGFYYEMYSSQYK